MDRRVTVLSIALPLLMIASFILGFYAREARPKPDPTLLTKVAEVSAWVNQRYPLDIPREKLERTTVDGLLGALDPYSQYFTPEEWGDYHERHMEGRFYGIGVVLVPDRETGYIMIDTTMADTPAFGAGLLANDLILAVDGVDLKDMPFQDIVKRIKGPKEGEKVRLTIYRKGRDRFDVDIARAKIEIKTVKHKVIEADLGYIHISDFTDMIAQFDKAMDDLNARGIKGLIVDVRFNGGGLLDAATTLCDRFVASGALLCRTKGKLKDDNREYTSKDDSRDSALPLIVLVNGESASASEIFAGAMRDLKRGTMVGSRTFGKGTMQTPIELSDRSLLKLTTAHWFTPSGTNVNKQPPTKDYGLEPDFLVEMSVDEEVALKKQWDAERRGKPVEKPVVDFPLNAAVELIRAKLAGREPNVARRDLAPGKPKPQ